VTEHSTLESGRSGSQRHLELEIAVLRQRLEAAEEMHRAIVEGEIDGFVVGVTDEERRIMLLGTAHRPYEAMVERMEQGAVTVSLAGEILYANDRFAAMACIARESLLGARLASFISPDDREALQAVLAQSKMGCGQCEVSITRRDGGALPVLITGTPVDSQDDVALMITDLTEQRRHREIETADRRKDEFLAVLAHELRNPLAPIRSAVQALRWMTELAPKARQAADIIARQSKILARLIDDLIDINRLNQGKITLQRRQLDLKEVVVGAVEAAQPLLEEHRHTLQVQFAPEPLYVEGDLVRLTQVMVNLLSNASKYTPPGGHVSVVLEPSEGPSGKKWAVIRVMDTGMGIPAHLLDKIFDPYVQVSTSSITRPGGLGLGLSLARRLVQLHEGTIAAQSGGSGSGSEFVVELPACSPPEIQGAAEEIVRIQSAPSSTRILIADDNVDGARSLAMVLELSGYATRTAHDGVEALSIADEFRPDIVLLDLGMPNLDGYAAARELRSLPWAQKVALVALSGWGQAEDVRRALEAGFDAHMVKPLDVQALERLIASLRCAAHD